LFTAKLELPLVRRVVRLGSWVIFAMLTQFFVNYFDTLMVGYLEGPIATASQAALGLGMPVFWAVGGFFAAIGVGTQAITARRYAEKQDEKAGQVLFNSLSAGIVFAIVGSTLGYFLTEPMLALLAEASPEQRALGTTYTQIRMIGIGGMVITFSYKAFFDGLGRTYIHLYAAVAMNVFNIILNYLFIYGNDALGIPRLELAGAGIASCISTYLGMFIMIAASVRPANLKRFKFYKLSHLDFGIIGRISQLMVPSGMATVILMTGFALFMKFVGDIDAQVGDGTNTYSAATKAIMDTTALCFMPLIAFGTATATCVSQSLGAGKPNLAARYGWESVRLGVFAMFIAAAVFLAIPEQIIGVLAPRDPAVAQAGALSLRLVTVALAPMAVGLILGQALFGAGANVFVAVAELIMHFGIFVPLAWLLGPTLGYGMEGAWIAAAVYATVLGTVMGIKFASPGWRKIKL
jgi:MATE family multidrug resistance protein